MFYSIKVINFGKIASTFQFYFAEGTKSKKIFRFVKLLYLMFEWKN